MFLFWFFYLILVKNIEKYIKNKKYILIKLLKIFYEQIQI